LLIGAYLFNCTFTSPALLPAFKGSTLRGAFGHAFKKVSCALRRQNCATCLLSETCPYSLIFENHNSTPEDAPASKVRISARPHPYTLQPPRQENLIYQKGEAFSFGITLFGKANDYLPHIVYAVDMMGENGIGRHSGVEGGRFTLDTVDVGGQSIYNGQSKLLSRHHPLAHLALSDNTSPLPPVAELTVTFQTPLRLKQHNQLQEALPFHLLIRAALRRLATLEQYYADGEPALDYRGLIRQAEGVVTLSSHCRWLDLERYSSRQKTAMFLGGLVGSTCYSGDLDVFLPILRYCQQTQLGKQTTFGLGQISLSQVQPAH